MFGSGNKINFPYIITHFSFVIEDADDISVGSCLSFTPFIGAVNGTHLTPNEPFKRFPGSSKNHNHRANAAV